MKQFLRNRIHIEFGVCQARLCRTGFQDLTRGHHAFADEKCAEPHAALACRRNRLRDSRRRYRTRAAENLSQFVLPRIPVRRHLRRSTVFSVDFNQRVVQDLLKIGFQVNERETQLETHLFGQSHAVAELDGRAKQWNVGIACNFSFEEFTGAKKRGPLFRVGPLVVRNVSNTTATRFADALQVTQNQRRVDLAKNDLPLDFAYSHVDARLRWCVAHYLCSRPLRIIGAPAISAKYLPHASPTKSSGFPDLQA